MSSKTDLYESKDVKLRYDAAVLLHRIADGLADGTLHIKDEAGSVCIAVSDELKVELKVEEKVKSEGVKRCVEIELSWTEPASK